MLLTFENICDIIIKSSGNDFKNVPVAQLDRVTGYEPVGRGFESLQARLKETDNNSFPFYFSQKIKTGNFYLPVFLLISFISSTIFSSIGRGSNSGRVR